MLKASAKAVRSRKMTKKLWVVVISLLVGQRWSPEQIAGRLRREGVVSDKREADIQLHLGEPGSWGNPVPIPYTFFKKGVQKRES